VVPSDHAEELVKTRYSVYGCDRHGRNAKGQELEAEIPVSVGMFLGSGKFQ
jgi:hypothetical protein